MIFTINLRTCPLFHLMCGLIKWRWKPKEGLVWIMDSMISGQMSALESILWDWSWHRITADPYAGLISVSIKRRSSKWAATEKRKEKAARSIFAHLIDTLSRHMPKEVRSRELLIVSCGYRPWDQNCRRTLLTQLTDRFFGRNSPSHGIFSCKRLT
jgi:hypothetical protein